MGEALIRGLVTRGGVRPAQITAADIALDRLKLLKKQLGISTTTSNRLAVKAADVILLAVKPNVVVTVVQEIGELLSPSQLVISIAAGVRIETIESALRNPVPVVRVMPNTPCLVGQSAAALAAGTHATEKDVEVAVAIFECVGTAIRVEEKLLDAVTGLSGSGPAYVYVFMEALSDAGVRMGLPRDVATRLAAQTVKGAAEMVLQTGKHPAALKDMVTSPGGTTIAGLHELERGKFRATVMNAVEAATKRAREMASG
jgi:pyrroline-5-carboxylate reductase